MSSDIAIALCKAIYNGETVKGGRFARFLFEAAPCLLHKIQTTDLSSANTWDDAKRLLGVSTPRHVVDFALDPQSELEAALNELKDDRVPDCRDFLLTIINGRATVPVEPIVVEYAAYMRSGLIQAARTASEICHGNQNLIAQTFQRMRTRIANPDAGVIGDCFKMVEAVLARVHVARDAFLGSQLPSYTPLAVLSVIAKPGEMIQGDTRIRYLGKTPLTVGKPSYLTLPDPSVPDNVSDILQRAQGYIRGGVIAPVIAGRLWTLCQELKLIGEDYGAPTPAMPQMGAGLGKKRVSFADSASGSASPVRVIVGGEGADALSMRVAVNRKFGQKALSIVKGLTEAVLSLAKNPSKELVSFFADSATRPLINAFMEIRFPSKAYVPILSGYYRTAETKSRRERYVSSLEALVASIEKIAGSDAKLDGASRNSFSKCKSLVRELIAAIHDSNREMDSIFAKLAAGQIKDITSGDSDVGKDIEKIEPASAETVEEFRDEHHQLTRALENLKEAAKKAGQRHIVLAGIDKLEEYLRRGKSLCADAVKKRMEDLTLAYTNLYSRVSAEAKEVAKRVIDFKLSVYREFYDSLIEFEMRLAKSYRDMVISPAIRDELYRAIAGWTLTMQKSGLLKDRFEKEMKAFIETVFAHGAAPFQYKTAAAADLGTANTTQILTPTEIKDTNKSLFDDFRRMLLSIFNYSPQLRLVFDLVNIFEKIKGKELDVKALFTNATRYILASAVDVCTWEEALNRKSDSDIVSGGFQMVKSDFSGVGAQEATGVEDIAKKEKIAVFFRHAIGKIRLEDRMFVRWIKAICANLLIALDTDRAIHGVRRTNLPGAERLLIGGALDDPIGITGSTHVIPEATPLYIHFRIACEAYRDYFSWDAPRGVGEKGDEPQLIIKLSRESRFYPALELIKGTKSESTFSDTYVSKLIAALNDVWGHYSSVSDPAKRVTAVFDAFFEEVNDSLLLQSMLEHTEASTKKEEDRDRDAISGIAPVEDRLEPIAAAHGKRGEFKQRTFKALKAIAMSVFDIVQKVNISEDQIAGDYKAYVDRIQKRITDSPDSERFRELVKAINEKDESVGDVQGLFMAFSEFVTTPLFALLGVVEGFVYRFCNCYMQVLRHLFVARAHTDIAADGLGIGRGDRTQQVNAGDSLWARFWYLYDAGNRNASTEWRATHAARVAHLLTDMSMAKFAEASITYAGVPYRGVATQSNVANGSNLRGFRVVGTKYVLPMHQSIYKAIELLLVPGTDLVTVKKAEGAFGIKVEAEKFVSMITDSLVEIRAAMSPFMKIGKKEPTEAFYREINAWCVGDMLNDVIKTTNLALAIVDRNFCAAREYLPNAVCYDQEVKVLGTAIEATGIGFVVNFRRNAILGTAIGKAALAYQEGIRYLLGSPSRWRKISDEMWGADRGGVHATSFTESEWTALDSYHGIFSPRVKVGTRIGPGVGFMPWTPADSQVIEGGYNSTPADMRAVCGPALNTPILFETANPANDPMIALSFNDVDAINAGAWADNVAAGAGGMVELGFSTHRLINQQKIYALNGKSIVQSALYGRPAFDSKAETLNRLIAKMASVLTIQGEEPVLLYDLAHDIIGHAALSSYFQTKNFTISGSKGDSSTTYTFLVNAIGTPVRVSENTYLTHNERLCAINPRGGIVLGTKGSRLDQVIRYKTDGETLMGQGTALANSLFVYGILGSAAAAQRTNVRRMIGSDCYDGITPVWDRVDKFTAGIGRRIIMCIAKTIRDGLDTFISQLNAIMAASGAGGVTTNANVATDTPIVEAAALSLLRFFDQETFEPWLYARDSNIDPSIDPQSIGESIYTPMRDAIIGFMGTLLTAGGETIGTIVADLLTANPAITAQDAATGAAAAPLCQAVGSYNIINTAGHILPFINGYAYARKGEYLIGLSESMKRGEGIESAGVEGAGEQSKAPIYKSGTFLYDAVLFPFLNSVEGQGVKRIGEMSTMDQARYLAAIPQLMTAFKDLLARIKLDTELDLNKVEGTNLNPATHMGTPLGASRHDSGAGNVAVNSTNGDIRFQAVSLDDINAAIKGIPDKMAAAIKGFIECLSRWYRAIREKYGNPVHMETVKGDFDPYLVGGKFDPGKLTTPLSVLGGTTMVGPDGPCMMMAFGERGHPHADDAMIASWASPVLHKELVGLDTIPLDCVPWTVALAERTKKMTHADLTGILQPIVTRTAKLTMTMNAYNMQAIACHSPFAAHSIPSTIFHPHSIEISVASMRAGLDLIRRFDIDHGNNNPLMPDWISYHLPFLYHENRNTPRWNNINALAGGYVARTEGIFADGALGSSTTGGDRLGDWARPPLPITRQKELNADDILRISYTVNPYITADDKKKIELRTSCGNLKALTLPNTFQTLAEIQAGTQIVWGTEPRAPNYPGRFAFFHGLGTASNGLQLGVCTAEEGVFLPAHVLAILIKSLRSHPADKTYLTDDTSKKFFIDRLPAFGSVVSSSATKKPSAWLVQRTKPKDLIDKCIGLEVEGEGETQKTDGYYIEMVRFSPPSSNWSIISAEERHRAGFFLYMKRNPISPLSSIGLVDFPSIYLFSETFDMYFQLVAARSAKDKGTTFLRSHVQSLLTNPLSISSHYIDYSVSPTEGNRERLVKTANLAITPEGFGNQEKPFSERTTPNPTTWQSLKPLKASSSIIGFYDASFPLTATVNDNIPTALCAPSVAAAGHHHTLISFPLFAMMIRFIDQAGVMLKDELATRLREIKYDRPESLAAHQNALIGILDGE